ncbi:hypothetical protein H6F67_25665 [Microcoleus sp. FACHB-1515]|uniref:hypothetical protein n=1 Tax=Cyanophyceae TaxID=3028117 RepID=UPI0016887ED4|nr:hypothetical protein [Microcoleus sp. FACHB-1515]MBD2093236.1 hypothetical protein [Microcoleus sp. FACHB-1515]
MGFLQWWVNNQEEPEEQQLSLDLNGHSSDAEIERHERVDGAVVNKDFRKAIEHQGGDDRAQIDSATAMSNELFDVSPAQLYRATGGRAFDRSTLPKDAQKAFIVGETIATYDLNGQEIQDTSQREINNKITDTVRESGKKAREFFPW